MALEWVTKIGGTNTPMSQDEKDNNILCIYGALKQYGWTDEAIAGACGCFHEESGYNPGVYETSHGGNINNLPYFPGGMGIAQWTDYPAYSSEYPNPLPWSADREGENWYNGNFQCWLLTKADDVNYTSMGYGQGPRWGWQTSSMYPSISFGDYKNATLSLDIMTEYWFYDMEWHYNIVPPEVNLNKRKEWAHYAYDLYHGKNPEVPGGGGTPTDPTDPSDAYYMYAIIANKNRRRRKNIGRSIPI